MRINPGDCIIIARNGEMHTNVVTSMHYSSGEPEVVRRLNWWRRIVRQLTPIRWRKSLVIQPCKPPTMRIKCGDEDEPLGRALTTLVAMQKALNAITDGRSN